MSVCSLWIEICISLGSSKKSKKLDLFVRATQQCCRKTKRFCINVSANLCQNTARKLAAVLPGCLRSPRILHFKRKRKSNWIFKKRCMKHLIVCTNRVMLTQTHLGPADTGMSIKLAQTGGMCILSYCFHSRSSDESLCPPSPFLAFGGWQRQVPYSELTFPGSFTCWKAFASFSFNLKMLAFIQCCVSWVTSVSLYTKPYLLHSAILPLTVPCHSSPL